MKTIKNSKEITTLEVGDKVVFGDLEYVVRTNSRNRSIQYYLSARIGHNNTIFKILNLQKRDFVEKLGITADSNCYYDFPETKSLEALTAIVFALFKKYEKQNELPKTWEEFCKNTPIQKGECLINAFSEIRETISVGYDRHADEDRTYFTSRSEAEAFLALMQLRQLRKAYVKDWEPDWSDCRRSKFSITCIEGVLSIFDTVTVHHSMSFPTYKLAGQFLTNFKDLLEIAKPLL